MSKIRFFIIVLVCWAFAGCKTSQKFAQQTKERTKVESVTEQTTETSVVKDLNVLKVLNDSSTTEINFSGTIWSAPDSTGAQYPQITFEGTKKRVQGSNLQQTTSDKQQTNFVTDTRTAVKGEIVAEQAAHLETTRWSFGDIIHLTITLLVMIVLIVIYFKWFRK